MTPFDFIYQPAKWFFGHPERSFVIAGLFLLLYVVSLYYQRAGRQVTPKHMLTPTVAWAVFGLFELMAMADQSNIRIDLLLTWPLVCILSLVALVRWLRSIKQEPTQ